MRAWATPELAQRVSGHVNVVLAVSYGPRSSGLVAVRSSLLAAGYLGTICATMPITVSELLAPIEAGEIPFGPVLKGSLRPVSEEEACWLAWGPFAFAKTRGVELRDRDIPGLGVIEPPSTDSELVAHYLGRFDPETVGWAEEIAAWHATQPPSPRGDMPDVLTHVSFSCRCGTPSELAAALDGVPGELARDTEDDGWLWQPPARGRSDPPEGLLQIDRARGLVTGATFRAPSAAQLATRLEELSPEPLRLAEVRWHPLLAEEEPEDEGTPWRH